ncbi:hypothetical protein SAMN04488035_0516 [Flavimobilis marinus]|uniref:Uncharacterized protein n=1 Tax=Flavimobilis marinus TaxID=285351 RepID=A0A1I2DFB3_9MICO|nr:hypothetical protein [Flavimobilis marinus]SFE78650.1 hypothetical protein SAMN04488035_0516 [Flavimobilis marinus]
MATRHDRTRESGNATAIESIGFSAFIALVAAIAAGWFDAMLPWL